MNNVDTSINVTEGSPERTTLSSYFSSGEWVLYTVLIVAGLLLRWTLLDMRPYHHDESLHGMYGRYFYDWPNSNFYKYDPMLHGPMLYNSMRLIYATFGDSLWAARVPVCLMGSAFLFVPLLFRQFFKKPTVLILTAFVALSPTLVYWSRFLREDYWVISGMLMVVYGCLLAPPRMKAFWFCLGLSIQWCTKENLFVTLAILFGYLAFETLFRFVFFPDEKKSIAERMVTHISNYPWEVCWSFIFAFLVYCWFYSAGFRYPEGIIEGLGQKGFEYWQKHHEMERIEGPFNFHIYVLGWYELPLLVAFITHLCLFYRRARPEIQMVGAVVAFGLILSFLITSGSELKQVPVWRFFKLKDYYDLVGLFILLFHAPIVTVHHLLRREFGLATCAYFFTATLFVYSYLGEKVPWLTLYPLIFSLPYLALFFQDYFQRFPVEYKRYPIQQAFLWLGVTSMIFGMFFILEEWTEWSNQKFSIGAPTVVENLGFLALGAILVICALFNYVGNYLGKFNVGRAITIVVFVFMLRAAIQTNFLYAGKETEYLSQVHTTYEIADFAKKVVDEVLFERNAYKPKVLVAGEGTWPLTWYFRHLPNEYRFSATPEEKKNFTYIVQDFKETPTPGDVPEGYYSRTVNLRGWWVPDFTQMTLRKFLRFSINHYPWNASGFTYATVLTAKDTSRFVK
jgi:uncharacterized protein (TIGR03663 family)